MNINKLATIIVAEIKKNSDLIEYMIENNILQSKDVEIIQAGMQITYFLKGEN